MKGVLPFFLLLAIAFGAATDVSIAAVVNDGIAPVISNALPTGTLSATSTTMSVTTDEYATCKYAATDKDYTNMTNTFSITGGTSHSQALTGLGNAVYTYYVRCTDSAGNKNNASTTVSFTVNIPTPGGGTTTSSGGVSFGSAPPIPPPAEEEETPEESIVLPGCNEDGVCSWWEGSNCSDCQEVPEEALPEEFIPEETTPAEKRTTEEDYPIQDIYQLGIPIAALIIILLLVLIIRTYHKKKRRRRTGRIMRLVEGI